MHGYCFENRLVGLIKTERPMKRRSNLDKNDGSGRLVAVEGVRSGQILGVF